MNIQGFNCWNDLVQTGTIPASSGFCWNRYLRHGPKTELLYTLVLTLGSVWAAVLAAV
jgi:hypothetical protein